MAGVNGIFFYGCYVQLILHKPFGDNPTSDTGLILITLFLLLFTLLFRFISLDVKINGEGIHVRFFPFRFSYTLYRWEDISQVYVREFSPLREYGGWGLRYSMMGNGKAYTISGKKGLQIELKDNRKFLIGTNQAEALTDVLNNFRSRKSN